MVGSTNSLLEQGVTDNLNVELIEIGRLQALGHKGAQRRVLQHTRVQLAWGCGHRDNPNFVKHAQRMALWEQFRHLPLVPCANQEENHIVNHVPKSVWTQVDTRACVCVCVDGVI